MLLMAMVTSQRPVRSVIVKYCVTTSKVSRNQPFVVSLVVEEVSTSYKIAVCCAGV